MKLWNGQLKLKWGDNLARSLSCYQMYSSRKRRCDFLFRSFLGFSMTRSVWRPRFPHYFRNRTSFMACDRKRPADFRNKSVQWNFYFAIPPRDCRSAFQLESTRQEKKHTRITFYLRNKCPLLSMNAIVKGNRPLKKQSESKSTACPVKWWATLWMAHGNERDPDDLLGTCTGLEKNFTRERHFLMP